MGYRGVILFPQAVTLRKEHTVAESNVSCQSLLTIRKNLDKIFRLMRCARYRRV